MNKTTFDFLKSFKSKNNLSKYFEKIRYYGFPGAKTYKKTSKDHKNYYWHKRNLLGEIYETLVYEALLDWTTKEDNVEFFVLKGPYIQNFNKSNGFGYNQRQIVLFGDGDRIAEFDCLLKLKDKWVFVEVAISENKIPTLQLRRNIARKRKLLKILTKSNEVLCLVVTPNKRDLDVFKKSKYNFNLVLPYPKKFESLLTEAHSRYKKLTAPKSKKLVSLKDHQIGSTNMRRQRRDVRKLFEKYYKDQINHEEFIKEYDYYHGVVDRVFLGTYLESFLLRLKDFELIDEELCTKYLEKNITKIVIALRFRQNTNIKIQLYLIPQILKIRINTLEFKDTKFKKYKDIDRRNCVLKDYNPIFDFTKKEVWDKITKKSTSIKLPKIE